MLVGTLIAWNYAFDWASFRWPWARHFVEPPPLLLIRHGRIQHRNLRREMITRKELQAELRANGIDDLQLVRKAYMESDGAFTVLRVNDRGHPPKAPDKGVPGA